MELYNKNANETSCRWQQVMALMSYEPVIELFTLIQTQRKIHSETKCYQLQNSSVMGCLELFSFAKQSKQIVLMNCADKALKVCFVCKVSDILHNLSLHIVKTISTLS